MLPLPWFLFIGAVMPVIITPVSSGEIIIIANWLLMSFDSLKLALQINNNNVILIAITDLNIAGEAL